MKPENKTDPAEYTRLVWPDLPEELNPCYVIDSIDITGYVDVDGPSWWRSKFNGQEND